jgi:DNA recombination-dependent growth factor C
MNDNNIIQSYDLEKMIKKVNKIAKDKISDLQSRDKRKLNIKEKKKLKKTIVEEDFQY